MNMRAKKSLGQNFLNAPSVVRSMLDAAEIKTSDWVIEVGPGKGVLTEALLERGAIVTAYELDLRMIGYLKERFASEIEDGKLTIIHRDILDLDIQKEIKESYKVIANIPYYITNAIIRLFLESKHQPDQMCLLVQKEVAERIARDQKESILSLSVKAYAKARYVTKVSARYFSPKPKVDSAVLLISDISRDHFKDSEHEQHFFDIVKRGFAHKRKQLASNLAGLFFDKEAWQQQLQDLDYPSSVRAENVSLEHWLKLGSK